ncbi:EmrB/QacA subfamily drug resistance transporter [Actinopolyspora biskrensis]|uniref:EmrB/QacA subfamily drug resistance transporter n=1 Tax=Actinopolyspora biskrensis TaxID=1470178 RepID=A0A852ZB82_9ACTN|nr:MDR family MFS transporter [Actinopolyspora biskrensis]NYH80776.1 EmrB/QacA subfamily drug resistance transporter [Actinopolyspora biskrensis]
MRTRTTRGSERRRLPGQERGKRGAFWAMMIVVFLAAMDSTVVATVLPAIPAELGSSGLLAWVVTSYLLTTAVSIPLWGKAADLTSRRRLYLVATAVFLLGSLGVASAPNMTVLLAARAVQGTGTGGLMALTPTIIGQMFASRIRGRFHGIQGAVLAGASIVGPLVGGFLEAALGWRWAFWINLPLVLPALLIAGRFLPAPEARAGKRRIDLVGAALLAIGASAFLLALSEGTPFASAGSRAVLLAAAAVTVPVYLLRQARHDDPVLPLRVLRSPVVAAAVGLSFISGAVMIAAVVHAPLYAQTVQERSAASAGLLLLPLTGGVLVANLAGGNLITWVGRYRPFLIGGTAATTTGFGVLATAGAATGIGPFTAALALVGIGIGLTMQPSVLALQNAVSAADLGSATAASTFFRQLGSTLSIGALGGLLTGRVGPQLSAITEGAGEVTAAARSQVATAFGDLFLILTMVAVVAFLLALLLPEKPLAESTSAEETAEETPGEAAVEAAAEATGEGRAVDRPRNARC